MSDAGPIDERPIDEGARQLITDTGLNRTLFVEAGAGSGKTTQLVERIVNLVLREGLRLSEIAAITFTEAAAAELQARVRVRFEREVEQTTDPQRRDRSLQAIADADMAAISTLHGFASRILGEFAVEAHIPPRVTVLDAVSSQLAHEARWERFVERLHSDPALRGLLTRAAVLDIALEQRYPSQATFRDVADVLAQNWDRIAEIAAADPPPLEPLDLSAIDAAVWAIRELPNHCLDPDDLFARHLRAEVMPSLDLLDAVVDPLQRLQMARGLKITVGKGGKKTAWDGDLTDHKTVVREFGEAVQQVVDATVEPLLKHLLRLTAREVLDAAQRRRDEGGLEFHDLLVLARELLRSRPRVRGVLHGRYRCLLLDEFQDTDPLQIDLATLIAASIGTNTDKVGDWNELEVQPGRLFFVGDPKQSIYRFRRADIGLFLAARDRFGDGETVELVTNFRTVKPILRWVNDLFSAAMPTEQPGAQPAYVPLAAVRSASPGADHRPVLLGGPHPDPKVRADVLREAEAADVAAVLADIRDHADAWPVFHETTKTWSDARLADVTVLVPTRTSLPFLRRALTERGIPYRLATGTLVYDTQEVRDALSVLRAIDDPSDRLSLVAALRSPLYACSDSDLFTFRHAGGRWSLRAAIPDELPDDHPVRTAMDHLVSLWERRWWNGPADLLDALLRERHAEILAFGDPRPTEVWRRLRFLRDQARSFEESGGGGLRDFLDWAELQGADGARVHEPMLAETEDAVSIMTVHGAKGLEFPIAVLSGMTTRPGGNRRGVSVLWGAGPEPAIRINASVSTADHEPRADLEQTMDGHEKLRLLYVAATRARDHLVVSCHHKAGDGPTDTYASRVWLHFREDSEKSRQWVAPTSTPAPNPATSADQPTRPDAGPDLDLDLDADRDDWDRRRQAVLDTGRRRTVTSATAIAATVRGRAEAEIEGDGSEDDGSITDDASPGATLRANEPVVRRKGRSGAAIGRAVHATLEQVDFAAPTDVDALVARNCAIEAIDDLKGDVADRVRSALSSPSVREAAERIHYKELPIVAPEGSMVIEGYVDLLIERPDGLVVVDYKTDAASTEAQIADALDRYELQAAAYAVALEKATGLPVVDCRFVFCNPKRVVERSVRDLAGAKAEVRASLV